jgi:adenylate cyclase
VKIPQSLSKLTVPLAWIPLAALVTALSLGFSGVLEPYALKALDQQMSWHRQSRADPRIAIVAVDQPSIDYFDEQGIPFPWPRSLYAPVLDYLADAGARAVLMDILFNNQGAFGAEDDRKLADAIARQGRTFLAAVFGNGAQPNPQRQPPTYGWDYRGDPPESLRHQDASLPIDDLRAAARGIGFVNQAPDADGIYRRVRPFLQHRGRLIPALGLAPLNPGATTLDWQPRKVRWDEFELPLAANGQVWLRHDLASEQFPVYSILDLIQSRVRRQAGQAGGLRPAVFSDRYVFVAYTAPGLFDLKPTPLSPVTPGVLIQATLLRNSLDQRFLRRAPLLADCALAAGLFVLLAFAIVKPRRLLFSLLGASLFSGLFFAFSQWSFAQPGIWWNLPLMLFSAAVSLLSAALYRYFTVERQRRHLIHAFSHYVAPEVVRQIAAAPEHLELGGSKREITLLFSDLANFSSLGERLDPQELVQVLNQYNSIMVETIHQHRGTVDKFIGDAVMAFWGAPLPQADQSRLAVLAGDQCLRRLRDFFAANYTEYRVSARIGIDRGECVVGNIGSTSRFDYTAIGDTVNQASRLEGLNKQYRTRMLVAERAWLAAGDDLIGRKIDRLKVKGKNRPVEVYEMLGQRASASVETQTLCRLYQDALERYLAQDWDGAIAAFAQLVADYRDAPATVMLERCRQLREQPPPADWDGSFAHQSK